MKGGQPGRTSQLLIAGVMGWNVDLDTSLAMVAIRFLWTYARHKGVIAAAGTARAMDDVGWTRDERMCSVFMGWGVRRSAPEARQGRRGPRREARPSQDGGRGLARARTGLGPARTTEETMRESGEKTPPWRQA